MDDIFNNIEYTTRVIETLDAIIKNIKDQEIITATETLKKLLQKKINCIFTPGWTKKLKQLSGAKSIGITKLQEPNYDVVEEFQIIVNLGYQTILNDYCVSVNPFNHEQLIICYDITDKNIFNIYFSSNAGTKWDKFDLVLNNFSDGSSSFCTHPVISWNMQYAFIAYTVIFYKNNINNVTGTQIGISRLGPLTTNFVKKETKEVKDFLSFLIPSAKEVPRVKVKEVPVEVKGVPRVKVKEVPVEVKGVPRVKVKEVPVEVKGVPKTPKHDTSSNTILKLSSTHLGTIIGNNPLNDKVYITANDKNIHVVLDRLGQSVFYSHSQDNGCTFSDLLKISSDVSCCTNPIICNNATNLIWHNVKQNILKIVSSVVSDSGEITFENNDISVINTSAHQISLVAVVDNANTIYCFWTDIFDDTNYTHLYFAKSSNNGKSWTQKTPINDFSNGKNNQTNICISYELTNDIFHVLWHDTRDTNDNKLTHLYYTYSTDKCESFQKNIKLMDKEFDFKNKVSLSSFDKKFYLLWKNENLNLTRYILK